MTIQEMFDLLREYRDAVDKVNNLNGESLTLELINAKTEKSLLALRVIYYLPKFTPMHCKKCRYYSVDCVKANRPFGIDYCGLYDVESIKDIKLCEL